ncbi:hypothetical protein [Saccharothrix saharensis]|uniref:hypothetical protein n=1 Tax=Saccharothrix saharensis TaxID=571190 RepID=UPI0014797E05|nr:hypothetical protein [Saccharothrix saharensis]
MGADRHGVPLISEPEFSAEPDHGRTTLTFHAWSGTQVTHHITKSSTAVAGSTT